MPPPCGRGWASPPRPATRSIGSGPSRSRTAPNFWQSKLRGLLLLVSLGTLFIVATLASGLVTGGLGHGPVVKVVGIVFALLLNFGLFFASFRLLTSRAVTTRELRGGVILAGIMWTILQALGGYYIGHVLKRSHGTYGEFAFVIALLIWLHLGAQMTLYAAEVNVVLTRRLWPRSLFGPPSVPADQRTLRALAKVEERSEAEHIDVEFKA